MFIAADPVFQSKLRQERNVMPLLTELKSILNEAGL